MFLLRGSSEPAAATASLTPIASAEADQGSAPALFLGSFNEGLEQPELIARAAAIEAALRRMLASVPEVRMAESPSSSGVQRYGARKAAEGEPALVAFSSTGEGPRVPLADPAAATAALAAWIAEDAGVPAPGGSPAAIAPFIEAVRQFEAGNRPQAAAALRRSTAIDPDFPAAQILAFEIFSSSGDIPSAIAAGEAILRTRPADHAVRARLFGWYRSSRDISGAIRHAVVLAENDQGGAEVLHFLARQALSSGDDAAFRALLPRLETLEGSSSPFHQPDILAAHGRFANAAQQYYQIEPSQPENPWLAFKIGRIAIMRHSTSVTEFEIEKLARLEPRYLHPLLEAYLAAGRRDREGAAAALKRAAAGATPDDAIHTASAEIWAILTDHPRIVASLRRATEAREPTCASILSNPLFAYLNEDRDFAPVRAEIARRRSATLQALASLQ
jgi:tetratricopeptide (TPR) repeat protein